MIVPDVNLLVYAYDNTSPHHVAARRWWTEMLSGDEAVGVPWVVTLAFVRLLTHPTICIHPLGVSEVRRRVEHWFEQDHVRLLSPGPVTLQHFFALLEEAGTGGNLSTDAMIAAHALEHAAVVHTADLDFGRFSKVRWVRPLAER